MPTARTTSSELPAAHTLRAGRVCSPWREALDKGLYPLQPLRDLGHSHLTFAEIMGSTTYWILKVLNERTLSG